MTPAQVAAGIVLYNPDISRLRINLDRICPQVNEVLLLDNASANQDDIRALLTSYSNITLIRAKKNAGMAGGLNRIFAKGLEKGYAWILTLDDDSICDGNLVSRLTEAAVRAEAGFRTVRTEETGRTDRPGNPGKAAIICAAAISEADREPFCNEQREGNGFGEIRQSEAIRPAQVSEVRTCITAGSLTSVKAWEEVGGFDGRMFIDFVDIEFCTRLRRCGYRILQVPDAHVIQRYGSISGRITLPGITLYRFNYMPKRIYYSVRNQIYYMKKHGDYIDTGKQRLYLAGYIGKHLVFEKNRRKTWQAVLAGIRDGRRMPVEQKTPLDLPRETSQEGMSPSVTVIMSAYNGEKYIREQIESILAQTYPHITLYVRDDGSGDGTWQILQEYAKAYSGRRAAVGDCPEENPDSPGSRTILCRKGKNRGFIESFLSALRDCPEADYYAWCDQDDVWMPDKVERAVKRLEAERKAGQRNHDGSSFCRPPAGGTDDGIPILYFTDYDFYDEQMHYVKHGLVHGRGPSFANSLMDCIPLGFNSVFNQKARSMILEKMPRHSCGHDWWTYMVCAAFGKVIYDKGYVSVKYRRLDTSVSPGGRGVIGRQIWRFRKFFVNDYFAKIRMQLREFAGLYLEDLEEREKLEKREAGGRPATKKEHRGEEKARLLRLFAHRGYSFPRALCKAFYPVRFRQGPGEELMVRALFLIGKL